MRLRNLITVTFTLVLIEAQDLFPLTIIHINDLHARYDDINDLAIKCKPNIDTCFGGYARNVAIIKRLQRAAEHSIYINAGDNYFGTLYWDMFKWDLTMKMLNLHPADAMTLGNHEFDDRVAGLVPFLEGIKSPMVVSNIDVTEESSLIGKYQETLILERGNRKIGMIGVITKDTPELSFPGKVKFLDGSTAIIQKSIELKSAGADIIVVISHCGLSQDRIIAQNAGLYVDVIIGSHSHQLLYNGTPPSNDRAADSYPVEYTTTTNGKKTLIVQALAFSKYVGHLKLYFNETNGLVNWEGNPIWAGPNEPKDPEVVAFLAPFKAQVDTVGEQKIGSTVVALEKDRCSIGECNYGSLINDAYVDYYINQAEPGAWTYASIGITNAGIIRVGMGVGNITLDDLSSSHPYENTVDTFEIRGADLRQALEISASNYGTVNFLQLSGLQVIYNLKAPPGSKVQSVKVRCHACRKPYYYPIGVNEIYRVAIASWIGDGGNGYTIFREARQNLKRGPPSFDVLKRYVEKISPITSLIDDRIQVLS